MSSPCRPTIRTRLVGADLRRRRRRSGLSEADVERRIGANPGVVRDVEAGRAVLDEVTERHILALLRRSRP
jgi:ribosome-binding protein aMBF1 (putative translation factor)